MKNSLKLFSILVLTAILGSTGLAPVSMAADAAAKEQPAKAEKEKKRRAYPFHGKLGALDKKAKSITLHGKEKSRTFYLTEKTKIQKNGKPATLEDAVIGEEVAGSVLPDENGKLMLNRLRIGPKPEKKKKPVKTEKKKDDEKSST